jgi:hypothetical protein
METNLICKNRTAALATLDAMADSLPKGTQRNALLAVRIWVGQNTQPEQGKTGLEELRKIFEGDEYDHRGREWRSKGGPPPDKARTACLWDAESQKWEPEFISPE